VGALFYLSFETYQVDFMSLQGAGVIVLAAGLSRRFGSQKLLHPIKMHSDMDARPILFWTLQNIRQSGLPVIAVVDKNQTEVIKLLEELNCEYVTNEHAEEGIGSSIAVAVTAIHKRWRATMIALGDMPFVAPETYQVLVEHAHSKKIVVPNVEIKDKSSQRKDDTKFKRGNPVVFGEAFYPDLMMLKGDKGGKALTKQHTQSVIEVSLDDLGILQDIDCPDDLRNL
jgi:molybdenum cofactor cytidylyltransferase